MNDKEKKMLLKLARNAIERKIEELDYPKTLDEKRGVFVTLTKKKVLRGCIGFIEPIMPLGKAVEECAYSAAYNDPRFPPVAPEELKHLRVEISILSEPKRLVYKDATDLLKKLTPADGVVLSFGAHSATFLPQVWEDIPDAEEFLGHLCMKAGLPDDEWRRGQLKIETYTVEKIKE